jgi:hypothetical protein
MLQRAIVYAFGLAAACAWTAASAEANVGIYATTRASVYAAPPVYAPQPPVVYAPAPILPVYGYGDKNNFYDQRRWHYAYGRERGWERQRGRW